VAAYLRTKARRGRVAVKTEPIAEVEDPPGVGLAPAPKPKDGAEVEISHVFATGWQLSRAVIENSQQSLFLFSFLFFF